MSRIKTARLLEPDFPHSYNAVQQLVKDHHKIEQEPLLLAIYYAPLRDRQDIFLFEVVERFGGDSVDEDRELFEVTYASRDDFQLKDGQKLHLVLTNPTEMAVAFKQKWKLAKEIRQAVRNPEAHRIIYPSPKAKAKRFLEEIRG